MKMAATPRPSTRATAAWAMARLADPVFLKEMNAVVISEAIPEAVPVVMNDAPEVRPEVHEVVAETAPVEQAERPPEQFIMPELRLDGRRLPFRRQGQTLAGHKTRLTNRDRKGAAPTTRSLPTSTDHGAPPIRLFLFSIT